jgi:hypothetical protein
VKRGVRAEAVAEQVGFGGDDGVGFALVEGEFADEAEDGGDVGGRGRADVDDRSWLHSGIRFAAGRRGISKLSM